jgi:hypothetical protein
MTNFGRIIAASEAITRQPDPFNRSGGRTKAYPVNVDA